MDDLAYQYGKNFISIYTAIKSVTIMSISIHCIYDFYIKTVSLLSAEEDCFWLAQSQANNKVSHNGFLFNTFLQ